jgi:hypothetical protein
MRFVIGSQPDGTFLLRFEDHSIRADIGLTRDDLERLGRQVPDALAATEEP